MNLLRLQAFARAYQKALTDAVTQHPEKYAYGVDKVPEMVEKMLRAWRDNTYSVSGMGLEGACKALGIPFTRVGINGYLNSPNEPTKTESKPKRRRGSQA